MKSLLRALSVALALGLALFPVFSHAAGPSPETRVTRLDKLVGLASDQKTQAAAVFKKEDAELLAVNSPGHRPRETSDIRQASRDRVRALLTPAQQKAYDRAPQSQGGSLTLPTPETKLARLDETVALTPEQKAVATQIFLEEFEGLLALAPADRSDKGMPIRQAAQDQVRALLTPQQQGKVDGVRQAATTQRIEEQTAVTNLLRTSNNLAARVGPIASVSAAGSSSTTEGSDGSRKGTTSYRVVGSTGSETLTVAWEKDLASGQIRIVRIEALSGETIQL